MKKYPKEFLENLYLSMLRIRLCEESFVGPIKAGEIKCPVHLSTGQEAIAAGVAAALGRKGYVFGTHRSHSHFIALGGSIRELIAELYGRETGCSKGRGGSMHINDHSVGFMGSAPIVAGTIPLALGCALAFKIRRERKIAVSFFGDGATGEGVLYESLNFAALKKLSLIFICENNLYSTHLPIRECRPDNNIFEIALPFGIISFRTDGNDVLKVYETAKKAVNICDKGNGPVFIEAMTYRLHGHVGPDDNIQGFRTDIRPKDEIEYWIRKDPLKRFEKFLLAKGILKDKKMQELRERLKDKISNGHDVALKSCSPKGSDLEKYVYQK